MHIFVRQYIHLQFDCEREEGYEEKRTMVVHMDSNAGAVRRINVAIERHASKIYTKAMFEQSGQGTHRRDFIQGQ